MTTMTAMPTETTETAQQYWDRHVTASPFNVEVHRPDVFKGTPISFVGLTGTKVYGVVGGLTETGYRVAVHIAALDEVLWVKVAAADVTLAPFPKPAEVTRMTGEIVETTQEHWERRQPGAFNSEVHRSDVRKGTRIAFPGQPGSIIYGVVASLTATGYSVAVMMRGIPNTATYVKMDASEATPAPFPSV